MPYCVQKMCPDLTATQHLAAQLASITQKGDTFALRATLGAGKSAFARAFIQALVSTDDVPSPTFTLLQTYPAKDFDIYHYDLYRLKSPEEIWELDIEEALFSNVTLIEWPEKMEMYLPRDIFEVSITVLPNNARLFAIKTNSEDKKQRLSSLHFWETNI
ncbi:MAG: tRNA (adenosine(37)-N6)-threonylcarbamoyltransferase complex ATPase subunit type 1 TsaE [Alphaproteobacteria bacterium]|nr:tRNA (adenosine(37)-N6)-threonylcarbamoyltransferase complex ATPase subunit type 1 TsaE [Alphaproteobacteria bacterium]